MKLFVFPVLFVATLAAISFFVLLSKLFSGF